MPASDLKPSFHYRKGRGCQSARQFGHAGRCKPVYPEIIARRDLIMEFEAGAFEAAIERHSRIDAQRARCCEAPGYRFRFAGLEDASDLNVVRIHKGTLS